MTRINLFIYFFLFCAGIFAQSIHYKMNGHFIGKAEKFVVLTKYINNQRVKDTVYVRNGKFIFQGIIPEPLRGNISGNDIWLDNGEMSIVLECKKDGSIKSIITNSKTNNEQRLLDKLLEGKNREEENNIRTEFIRTHPDSYVSMDAMSFLAFSETIPLEEEKRLFNCMTSRVRNSFEGKEVEKVLNKEMQNAIGVKAPDFKAKEYSEYWLNNGGNDTIQLSDFRGKVVLLDFWAYWCVPCRQSFPFIMETYRKFHKQGFEIMAVNTDFRTQGLDKWKKAIEETQTSIWHHVNVAEDLYNQNIKNTDIYANYFVLSIPRKILIDKNGMIRGNWVGFSEKTENELRTLVEQLVNE